MTAHNAPKGILRKPMRQQLRKKDRLLEKRKRRINNGDLVNGAK